MGFGRRLDFGLCDLVAESSPNQREIRGRTDPQHKLLGGGGEVLRRQVEGLTDSRAYL